MKESYKRRRLNEDYVQPGLQLCSWMGEETRRKNALALKKLLGNKKKTTIQKEKRELDFYHLRDDTNAYLVLFSETGEEYLDRLGFGAEFIDGSDWKYIYHQTAGYACHSHLMEAKFLMPTRKTQQLMEKLLETYNDSCISGPSLKVATEYEHILNEYGLSANHCAFDLEEGFYPIDIECLRKVTREKFPANLQDLVKKRVDENGKPRWTAMKHFKLAIIGPNCD